MSDSKAEKKSNTASSIISVILAIVVIWYFYGGGLEKDAANSMKSIQNQVVADAVKQYEIAKRNGTAMDICVQAGLVSASYLQAQDESNYSIWKMTEKQDCARAGIPQ